MKRPGLLLALLLCSAPLAARETMHSAENNPASDTATTSEDSGDTQMVQPSPRATTPSVTSGPSRNVTPRHQPRPASAAPEGPLHWQSLLPGMLR